MPKGIYKHKLLSEEHKKKISKSLSGKKSYRWLGNNVGYRGIHDWVRKNLGIPSKCENGLCKYPRKNARGNLMENPRRYEWANKNHKYRRKISDYISLCTSCHRNYDIKNNNYKND